VVRGWRGAHGLAAAFGITPIFCGSSARPASFKARLPFWTGALWLLATHLLVIGFSYLGFKFIERPPHRALTGR
jgi:hypothetical protein